MSFPPDILDTAATLLTACRASGTTLTAAESCTGGLVLGALTEIAGSSDVVDRGFVTYSNAAKQELLGVPAAILAAHGAVSEATAAAMARGALERARTGLAIAVTGIAGPGGATPTKPVGRVHIAVASPRALSHERLDLGDIGRAAVREESVRRALALALRALERDQAGRAP
jgi:nicotinamide-nucleotide amidase